MDDKKYFFRTISAFGIVLLFIVVFFGLRMAISQTSLTLDQKGIIVMFTIVSFGVIGIGISGQSGK